MCEMDAWPITLTDEPDWMRQAACAALDPEVFSGTIRVNDAKAVCIACPVQPNCLEFALDAGETTGVWGGLTPSERKALRISRGW